MKLIIEKIDGCVYVYRETEQQYKRVEAERSKSRTKVAVKVLDEECDMTVFPDNSYVVINEIAK